LERALHIFFGLSAGQDREHRGARFDPGSVGRNISKPYAASVHVQRSIGRGVRAQTETARRGGVDDLLAKAQLFA